MLCDVSASRRLMVQGRVHLRRDVEQRGATMQATCLSSGYASFLQCCSAHPVPANDDALFLHMRIAPIQDRFDVVVHTYNRPNKLTR